MKKILILVAWLLSAALAHAGEWGIQVHVHSMHFADRIYEDWNEDTEGFALRYSYDKTYAVQAGHYRNEQTVRGYNFFANYVIGEYTPLSFGPLHFGVYGGLVSGYNDFTIAERGPGRGRITSETDSGVNPTGGLTVRWDVYRFNVLARLHPDLPHAGPASIATEVGFRF